MNQKLKTYLQVLDVKVRNENLYTQAFTHPTFANENRNVVSYQKLEFLGDSVLGMYATEFIFRQFPQMDEGDMTILKASIVQGDSLYLLSLQQGFDAFIIFGKTRENLAKNKKVLEDVFEAFIGALYLDQGFAKVKVFLNQTIAPKIIALSSKNLKNPKTILQEYLQAEKRGVVQYNTYEKNNLYKAEVVFDNTIFGIGTGTNKKEAEVSAAKNALEKVGVS